MVVHEITADFFAAAPSALHLSKGAIPSTVNEESCNKSPYRSWQTKTYLLIYISKYPSVTD